VAQQGNKKAICWPFVKPADVTATQAISWVAAGGGAWAIARAGTAQHWLTLKPRARCAGAVAKGRGAAVRVPTLAGRRADGCHSVALRDAVHF
jgi:hypothetical protein